jgi:hypothetical protein
MAKERAPNPGYILAYKFVTKVLEEEFDALKHGIHLRNAKLLLKPKDGKPLDPDSVLGCCLALKAGMFDFDGQINNMWVATYMGESATYYEEYCEWVKIGPRWYVPSEVSLWEMCTGFSFSPPSSDIIDSTPELPYPIS